MKSNSNAATLSLKRITKVEMNERLKVLEEKVQELEKTSDSVVNQFTIVREILSMLADFPLGKRIVNRAMNRAKLRYLKNVILPRRQKELMKIQTLKMPEPIKAKFTDDELKLLMQAQRAICHREYYEKRSAEVVTKIMKRIQVMFTSFGRKPIESTNSKSIGGGKNARVK